MSIFTSQLQLTKIYEVIHPCKEKTETWKEARCPCICLSVAINPLEKSLIHMDPLLICLADTAKTCVPVLQHDHSCFRQEWMGTLALSALQNEIKWNRKTNQAGIFPDRNNAAPFITPCYPNALENTWININFHLWAACKLIAWY